jgi:hypothetical protein
MKRAVVMKHWWWAFVALSLLNCTAASLPSGSPSRTWDSGVSPGTVTIHVSLPAWQTFCDSPGCYAPTHVTFKNAVGVVLGSSSFSGCLPECAPQCQPIACPEICADPNPVGKILTALDTTWDGTYVVDSVCGAAVSCFYEPFAAPGHYLAQVCVTPGAVAGPDAGGLVCTTTGPSQCIDVPFDLPGPNINFAWPTDGGAGD